MSKINDAIKSAQDASAPPPSFPRPAAAAPTPAAKSAAKAGGSPSSMSAPAMVMVVAMLAGCWFLIQSLQPPSDGRPLAPRPEVVAARGVATEPGGAPDAATVQAFAKSAGNLPLDTFVPAPVNADPGERDFELNPEHEAPAAPAIPAYRLQGIFFRVRNPSAVINSKSVAIGDRIDNARVTGITRNSVTLSHDGRTEVLTLKAAGE